MSQSMIAEIGIPGLNQHTTSELESIISGVATSKTNRSATERLFGKAGIVKAPHVFTTGVPTTYNQVNGVCEETWMCAWRDNAQFIM